MSTRRRSEANRQKPLIPSNDAKTTFEIEELDEAGNVRTTYIRSPGMNPDLGIVDPDRTERIDIFQTQEASTTTSYYKLIVDAFLPVGFPDSVTGDYLEYQIFDSLQAFSSSIAGMLSSRAVLEGIGVGSTHTTPTAALLLSILQSSLGRLATIAFASQLSHSLEPECKAYRLLADIFNDLAIILDCLSPIFPTIWRVGVLSAASVLRALCGIAAGSSKASLSAHFAKNNNVGELAAKDSSQETVISLMGMLAGSLLVPYIISPLSTWLTLLFLLSIHLYTNYRAVRAVCLPSLNGQRSNLVFSKVISQMKSQSGTLDSSRTSKSFYKKRLRLSRECDNISLEEIRHQERIFELPSLLRFQGGPVLGTCTLGVPLQQVISVLPSSIRVVKSGSIHTSQNEVSKLLGLFENLEYILWYDINTSKVSVVWKDLLADGTDEPRTTNKIALKARFHALLLLWYFYINSVGDNYKDDDDSIVVEEDAGEENDPFSDKLYNKMWDALEITTEFMASGKPWGDVWDTIRRNWNVEEPALLLAGKGKVRLRVDEKDA